MIKTHKHIKCVQNNTNIRNNIETGLKVIERSSVLIHHKLIAPFDLNWYNARTVNLTKLIETSYVYEI